MDTLKAFDHQQYMNLETYRKSGEGVRTPVWFVVINGDLCFTTEATSAKVKRMRRNPVVKFASCRVNGELLGDWHPGKARFLSADEIPVFKKAYTRKYGIQKMFFDLFGRMRRRESTFIAIRLDSA